MHLKLQSVFWDNSIIENLKNSLTICSYTAAWNVWTATISHFANMRDIYSSISTHMNVYPITCVLKIKLILIHCMCDLRKKKCSHAALDNFFLSTAAQGSQNVFHLWSKFMIKACIVVIKKIIIVIKFIFYLNSCICLKHVYFLIDNIKIRDIFTDKRLLV